LRIGLTSDTHGDAAAWRDLLDGVFRGADLIVHAGDILHHGPRYRDTVDLAALINACPCPVLFARGNCDHEEDQLRLAFPIWVPYVFLQVEGLRILAAHGNDPDEKGLLALARRFGAQLAVCGHTHVARLAEEDGVVLVNPGSPALPKGGVPTAAVLVGNVVRLYNLRDRAVVAERKMENGR